MSESPVQRTTREQEQTTERSLDGRLRVVLANPAALWNEWQMNGRSQPWPVAALPSESLVQHPLPGPEVALPSFAKSASSLAHQWRLWEIDLTLRVARML